MSVQIIECSEAAQKIIDRMDRTCYEQIEKWAALAQLSGIDGYNGGWMWTELRNLVGYSDAEDAILPDDFSINRRISDIIDSAVRAGVIVEVR